MELHVPEIKTQWTACSTMMSSFLKPPILDKVSADDIVEPPLSQTFSELRSTSALNVCVAVEAQHDREHLSHVGIAVAGASVFVVFSGALVFIYLTMPTLDPGILRIPRDITDLQVMKERISQYTEDYTLQVLPGYVVTYTFMQTFMIPGTIFLSLLAGAMFGVYKGVLLVVFSATVGASSCFLMSKFICAPIAAWCCPRQIQFFRSEVAKQKGKLLNYMLFLRITPTLPNTFINFASPIVGIPYHIFLAATIVGLVPASFLTVKAGNSIGHLESFSNLNDVKTMVGLFTFGLCFILPTILSRQPQKAV